MSVIQILLEIPKDIEEGLRCGKYVRDAAGVIRNASNGQIVAHLKEISLSETSSVPSNLPPSPTSAQALGPFAAMSGIVIACTMLIMNKLDSMDKKLDLLLDNQRKILDKLDELYQFNIKEYTVNLFQAKQFLLMQDYEKACEYCVRSTGAILNYILQNAYTYHMKTLANLNFMLSAFANTIYIHCQAQNFLDATKTGIILKGYEHNFQTIMEKFSSEAKTYRDSIKHMILSQDDLKIADGIKASAALKNNITNAIEFCESECIALEAIQTMPELKYNKALEQGYVLLKY